jgi:hypothetical protein
VDYRSKTNAAKFWDTGYTKERPHMGGIGQGKDNTKTLNEVDVLTIQE